MNPERFNAGVDAYNRFMQAVAASCSGRNYLVADKQVTDAELSRHSSELRAEGVQLVARAMNFEMAPPTPTLPTPSTPPGYAAPMTPPAPSPSPNQSQAFSEGLRDRQGWETWFNGLGGAFRDGAEWWASVRSTRPTPVCTAVPGTDRAEAIAGCNAARTRLSDPDRRRRAEPDYRGGWNSP